MEFAEQAWRNRRREPVRHPWRQAMLLERQAAELIPKGVEPTRSVLYRSAAWLAVDCHDYVTAVVLALRGLEDCLYSCVERELRQVLTAAYRARLRAEEVCL